MTSVSELMKRRKISSLGRTIEIGPHIAHEDRYLSRLNDKYFETALDVLGVDNETKEKYLESLRNLDRKNYLRERLALIGTAKEEAERLSDDKILNRREEVSPLDDRKIFIKMGRCFMYQTITPNRFPLDEHERESFDMLVFSMKGVKSRDLVSRISDGEDDAYDAIIPYEDHPRKAVISTEGLRNIGLGYNLTKDRTGIILNCSELPEEKNLHDSINKENLAY